MGTEGNEKHVVINGGESPTYDGQSDGAVGDKKKGCFISRLFAKKPAGEVEGGKKHDGAGRRESIDIEMIFNKLEEISKSIDELRVSLMNRADVNKKNDDEASKDNGHNKSQAEDIPANMEVVTKHIRGYKNNMRIKYYLVAIIRVVIILTCLAGVVAILCAISITKNKLSVKVLLVFLIVVLLAFSGFMVYRMIVVGRRYRAALDRLNLLDLRLKLKQDYDLSSSKLERELQIIARILESSLIEGR